MSKQFSEVLHEWTGVFMHRSFTDFKNFMNSADISASQTNSLMLLYHNQACSLSDVSGHLGVTNAATSQLVDGLVQLALVSRTEDTTDRRNKLLELTPKGRDLIQRAIASRSKWMEELTTVLTPEEQAHIMDALTLLTGAALRLEPAAGQSRKSKDKPSNSDPRI